MTEQDKKKLIIWLQEGILCREEYGFKGNVLAAMEVALASLTAQGSKMQTVKAPKQDRGTYPPARIKQARDMEWIRAIRAAGGTVQESE